MVNKRIFKELVLKRFTRLFVLFLFCLCAVNLFAAKEGRITDIRFWQSPEEAQIVVDISSPPKVSSVSRLKDGTLYFDIARCKFRPGRQRYPLRNPFIDVLTVQQKKGKDMVRVFFRVPDGVEAKTFVLPANERKGDRIVIFLKGPAKELLEKRQAKISEVKKLKAENVKIVVLDPGHGGEDPGCHHNGILEKDYVLNMGKLVKAYFDRDPRFKAILTRNGDYIIPLEKRREISERLGADAFVSLHVNYNPRSYIRGIEVYYESKRGAVGEAERLVAQKENMVDFGGKIKRKNPANVKKEIIARQAETLYKSSQLASKVENRLEKSVSSMPSRGVKRAGFVVLHSMTMPSILVEFGYTSNRNDVKVLKNYTHRTRLAQGVYLGVRDFLLGKVEDGIDTTYLAYIKSSEARKARMRRAAAQRRKKLERERKKARKYKVRKGDTLSEIAVKHRVSLTKLLRVNKFSKNQVIRIGEVILIPAR
jgi:N-acetylmuramoyl-L-alanine amidase